METEEIQLNEGQQLAIDSTPIETSGAAEAKKKWPIRLTIILAASVLMATFLFALVKSKPNESHFELWVKKEAAEKRGKTSNVVQKGVSIATQIQVLATYKYSDYQVFAIVKAKANGDKMTFVGIANTWVMLP